MVRGLYTWICGHTAFENSIPVVDCLYIEMNSFMHSIGSENVDEQDPKFFEILCKAFQELVEMFAPKRIFVSFDGVFPFAKCQSYRDKSYSNSSAEDEVIPGQQPRLNQISFVPGSEQFNRFNAGFFVFTQNFAKGHGIEIKYNSQYVPGEAELKIFKDIAESNNSSSIICSNDAELTLFALLSPKTNIFNYFYTNKNLLSIDSFKQWISEGTKIALCSPGFNSFIRDFVLAFLIFGNDVLPGIPSLSISRKGSHAVASLVRWCGAPNRFIVNDDYTINIQNFKSYISDFKSNANIKSNISEENGLIEKIDPESDADQMVYEYFKGLEWSMKYYSGDLISWTWSYPYHSAPSISQILHQDMRSIIPGFHFDLGCPISPIEMIVGFKRRETIVMILGDNLGKKVNGVIDNDKELSEMLPMRIPPAEQYDGWLKFFYKNARRSNIPIIYLDQISKAFVDFREFTEKDSDKSL